MPPIRFEFFPLSSYTKNYIFSHDAIEFISDALEYKGSCKLVMENALT
jgi:hypothetical protein